MPSIYNHENACWGIKRTSCDMFHNVFKEEFQRNKLRENTSASDKLNETPNNTYVQYSVSSNGYYGYQPHKVIQEGSNTNEVEMEVEDIGETAGVSQNNDNTSRLGCVSFNVDLQNHLGRRKRQMTNDSTMDGSKRIRQEENGGGWSLRCRRIEPSKLDLSEGDYESTTTELLRQTHGCELYLLERTCDY